MLNLSSLIFNFLSICGISALIRLSVLFFFSHCLSGLTIVSCCPAWDGIPGETAQQQPSFG